MIDCNNRQRTHAALCFIKMFQRKIWKAKLSFGRSLVIHLWEVQLNIMPHMWSSTFCQMPNEYCIIIEVFLVCEMDDVNWATCVCVCVCIRLFTRVRVRIIYNSKLPAIDKILFFFVRKSVSVIATNINIINNIISLSPFRLNSAIWLSFTWLVKEARSQSICHYNIMFQTISNCPLTSTWLRASTETLAIINENDVCCDFHRHFGRHCHFSLVINYSLDFRTYKHNSCCDFEQALIFSLSLSLSQTLNFGKFPLDLLAFYRKSATSLDRLSAAIMILYLRMFDYSYKRPKDLPNISSTL